MRSCLETISLALPGFRHYSILRDRYQLLNLPLASIFHEGQSTRLG